MKVGHWDASLVADWADCLVVYWDASWVALLVAARVDMKDTSLVADWADDLVVM